MKKALLVLLLLAVAGGLFAQVTWSGHVYTDFVTRSRSDGDDDTVDEWGIGWGTTRARLQGAYRNEAGTVGGTLRLQTAFNGTNLTNGNLFATAYGWFTMFDKKLKILGGKWYEGEFYEGVNWADETFWENDKYGIAAYVYPVEGIKLGFGVHAGTNLANTHHVTDWNNLYYWVAAGYETDELGVYGQFDYNNSSVNAKISGSYSAGPISAALRVDLARLDDFAASGYINLGQYVWYDVTDDLGVDLTLTETIYGEDVQDKADFAIDVGAYYTLDVLGFNQVGLMAGFASENGGDNGSSLYFQPYVRWGLGGSRYLRLDYAGTILLPPNDVDADPQFENWMRLRFYFSF